MRMIDGLGYSLDGLDLNGTDDSGVDWLVFDVEDWDSRPATTGQVLHRPFSHGGWMTPAEDEKHVMRLTGRLQAGDRVSGSEGVRQFKRVLPMYEAAVLARSMDGVTQHRRVRVYGVPKIVRPSDTYVTYDVIVEAPDSRILSGDGSTLYQHSATAFLPSTSGGLQVLGAEVLRKNLATNPSFEVDVAGWSPEGGATLTASTDKVFVATRALRMFTAVAGSYAAVFGGIPVTPGLAYNLSAYVANAGTARPVQLSIRWFTLGGAVIGTDYGSTVNDTAEWQRLDVQGIAPALAETARLRIGISGTVVNEAHYADAVLFQQSPTAGTYFDGSTPNTASRTYAWTGAPNNSASTESSVGGIQAPFSIGATVVNGSVTVTATGDAPPPVLVRINGPVVQPVIRDELGGQMPLDISLSAGQWLDVDLDARTIKINSTVNRRNLLRGPWITPRPGMVLSLDAAVYNPLTSMTVFWTDASY